MELLGSRVEAVATSCPGNATQLAREAAESGAERVYAYGGDGTIRETAAGLLGSETALGVLPGGTTNVVARALELPQDPLSAAAQLAACSRHQEIDVGRCGNEIFLMQATAGLDAAIMAGLNPRLKRFAGKAGVALGGLLTWSGYAYPELELEVDGQTIEGATYGAVCNLALYAGFFRLIPTSSCRDRQLDLLIFRGRGKAATLGFAADLLMGKHASRNDVEIRPAQQVRFAAPAPIQIDGDVLSPPADATIELADHRLHLLWPTEAGPSIL